MPCLSISYYEHATGIISNRAGGIKLVYFDTQKQMLPVFDDAQIIFLIEKKSIKTEGRTDLSVAHMANDFIFRSTKIDCQASAAQLLFDIVWCHVKTQSLVNFHNIIGTDTLKNKFLFFVFFLFCLCKVLFLTYILLNWLIIVCCAT